MKHFPEPSSRCSRTLLDVPRPCQTLPDLRDAPRRAQTLPDAARRPRISTPSQMFSSVPRHSQTLPDAASRSQTLPENPRRSQMLPDAPRQTLPDASRRSQTLPDAPKTNIFTCCVHLERIQPDSPDNPDASNIPRHSQNICFYMFCDLECIHPDSPRHSQELPDASRRS